MKSIREQILDKVLAAFQAVQEPDTTVPGYTPSLDDWPLTFSTVGFGPLTDTDHRKRYSIGIVTGSEREKDAFPLIQCTLTVGIEFRITVNQNDPSPAVMGERVLTVVKRVIDNNKTWGGLAVDTRRTNNEIDLTSYGDKTVMGVQFVEIIFRHSIKDVRSNQAEF